MITALLGYKLLGKGWSMGSANKEIDYCIWCFLIEDIEIYQLKFTTSKILILEKFITDKC